MSFNPDSNVCIKEDVVVDNPDGLVYSENLHIGHRTTIQAGGGVKLGKHVIISEDVVIWSINHHYEEGCLPYGFTRVRKPIVIEDNVWIGRNAMIAPGTHIGEGAVVALGAVVSGKVPPLAVVAGNPAKVVRFRSLESYVKALRENANLWTRRKIPNTCPACDPKNFTWAEAGPSAPRSLWKQVWDRLTFGWRRRQIQAALESFYAQS